MKHYITKLEETIIKNWDNPALSDLNGASMTFGGMALEIERLHALFSSFGIQKGDKIAICSRNNSHWAIAFLATVTYNAVAVPILYDFTHHAIRNLVKHSESRILFTDQDISDDMEYRSLPCLDIAIDTAAFQPLHFRTEEIKSVYERLTIPDHIEKGDIHYDCKGNDKDIALINYTSGTTSAPKGVMLKHEGISYMLDFAQKRVPAQTGDTLVSMLPMAHMYGLMFELLYPLISGVHINYLGKTPSPSTLMKAMKAVRPYMIVSVPLVMEKIYKNYVKPVLEKPLFKLLVKIPVVRQLVYSTVKNKLIDAFGGRIRHFIIGGAALNPDTEDCFRKIRLPYTVGYGMTEASPLITYEDWYDFRAGTCGKPIDCVSVIVNSEDPCTVAGEILVKGPSIFAGYYKNQEATDASFTHDGYFKTGDLGLMDEEGNLVIKGRCKTMILSSDGQNIYPEEVEAVINNQPGVVESIVVERSNRLVALVCMDPDSVDEASMSEEDISRLSSLVKKLANLKLPKYSQISKVEIRFEAFAKTPKMSIKRYLYA